MASVNQAAYVAEISELLVAVNATGMDSSVIPLQMPKELSNMYHRLTGYAPEKEYLVKNEYGVYVYAPTVIYQKDSKVFIGNTETEVELKLGEGVALSDAYRADSKVGILWQDAFSLVFSDAKGNTLEVCAQGQLPVSREGVKIGLSTNEWSDWIDLMQLFNPSSLTVGVHKVASSNGYSFCIEGSGLAFDSAKLGRPVKHIKKGDRIITVDNKGYRNSYHESAAVGSGAAKHIIYLRGITEAELQSAQDLLEPVLPILDLEVRILEVLKGYTAKTKSEFIPSDICLVEFMDKQSNTSYTCLVTMAKGLQRAWNSRQALDSCWVKNLSFYEGNWCVWYGITLKKVDEAQAQQQLQQMKTRFAALLGGATIPSLEAK